MVTGMIIALRAYALASWHAGFHDDRPVFFFFNSNFYFPFFLLPGPMTFFPVSVSFSFSVLFGGFPSSIAAISVHGPTRDPAPTAQVVSVGTGVGHDAEHAE